jgi:hypothetical protein
MHARRRRRTIASLHHHDAGMARLSDELLQGLLECSGTEPPAAGEPGRPPKPLKGEPPPPKRGMLPMLPEPGRVKPGLSPPLPGRLKPGMLLPGRLPLPPAPPGIMRSKGGKVCGCTTVSSFFSAVLMFLASAVVAAATARTTSRAAAAIIFADLAISLLASALSSPLASLLYEKMD